MFYFQRFGLCERKYCDISNVLVLFRECVVKYGLWDYNSVFDVGKVIKIVY